MAASSIRHLSRVYSIPGIEEDLGPNKATLGAISGILLRSYAAGQMINGNLADKGAAADDGGRSGPVDASQLVYERMIGGLMDSTGNTGLIFPIVAGACACSALVALTIRR